MSWAAIATVASAIIGATTSAVSAKKQGKKSREAMQEQAYIEGAAPYLPGVGDVDIDEIGNLLEGTDVSALIDAMSYGEGGDEIFQLLKENPQLMDQLPDEVLELMPESSGIMSAAHGGAVGTPKDVYYFSVPNIQQMMGDPDAQVQNVGNAMMGQLQGNPDQGMVGATPGQIQQMARGGAIYEKKY